MRHIEKACELINSSFTHSLEFGVYKGITIEIMRNKLPKEMKIFGFDSFMGLPEDWKDEDGNIAGEGTCTKGQFSAGGVIPNIEGVEFFQGWFEDTIPNYLKIAQPISLLHVDCDLYSSTKTVLYNLNDYIVKDTIIVFDEWFYNYDPKYNNHEQKCFYEWVGDFNREFELINHKSDLSFISNEQQIVKIIK